MTSDLKLQSIYLLCNFSASKENAIKRGIMKKFIFALAMITSIPTFANPNLVLNMKLSPAGSFEAKSQEISSDVVKKNGEFTAKKIEINVNTLKTENELRDEHLWKHLNYQKFAKAVLTDLKGKDGKATAQMEIAGVKRPVSINYQEKGQEVVASFKVSAKDYKLPNAEYLGVGVSDEVKGEVTLPFKSI
jgi:polyisoprenoid-binding protein YceI